MAEQKPQRDGSGAAPEEFSPDQMNRVTAPPQLEDDEMRRRWGLGSRPKDRGPYMVELNVQHVEGLMGAARAFSALVAEVRPPGDGDEDRWRVTRISPEYFRCELTMSDWKRLVAADHRRAADKAKRGESGSRSEFAHRAIYRLWPDFPVRPHISHSVTTIKGDAALRSFASSGEGICWAVLDSGVDAGHPHFGPRNGRGQHALRHPSVRALHRCFVDVDGKPLPDPDEDLTDGQLTDDERGRRIERHQKAALQDPFGHGTHVAGIIAGRASAGVTNVVLEQQERIVLGDEDENEPRRRTVTEEKPFDAGREEYHGVAPDCRLISLRVLDKDGGGRSSDIVRALVYIRERLNDNPKVFRVHGVNLSVGYDFDAEMFACGQSPLCSEVNRLVKAGVVVVTAAGNTGYSTLPTSTRVAKVGLANTINDPGNAELAITVGSTHRDSPHTFGVSYFSSKGPTADGRPKPDLVAPGERIRSCAAGSSRAKALDAVPREEGESDGPREPAKGTAYYVENSGTSMAAPHVSGAIAAFLSVHREFIGRPEEVKQVFLDSATTLGRERYFQGHGLVDLMRAIQAV